MSPSRLLWTEMESGGTGGTEMPAGTLNIGCGRSRGQPHLIIYFIVFRPLYFLFCILLSNNWIVWKQGTLYEVLTPDILKHVIGLQRGN